MQERIDKLDEIVKLTSDNIQNSDSDNSTKTVVAEIQRLAMQERGRVINNTH